jgi:hypothetical protein
MEQSPSWEADQFSQLTKKFPAFYGTRGFFTVLTTARHLSLRTTLHPAQLRENITLEQATKAERQRKVKALLFFNLGARWGGQHHAPATLTQEKETRYPLYRRFCGPQYRSGRVRKISPTLAFEPLTVQPIGSRFTDRAIAAQ